MQVLPHVANTILRLSEGKDVSCNIATKCHFPGNKSHYIIHDVAQSHTGHKSVQNKNFTSCSAMMRQEMSEPNCKQQKKKHLASLFFKPREITWSSDGCPFLPDIWITNFD